MWTFRLRLWSKRDSRFSLLDHAPLLPVVVSLMVGIFVSWGLRDWPPATAGAWFVSFLLFVAGTLLLLWKTRGPSLWLSLLCCFAVISFGGCIHKWQLRQAEVDWGEAEDGRVGRVEKVVKVKPRLLTLDVETATPDGKRNVTVRAFLRDTLPAKVMPGDRILFYGRIRSPQAPRNPGEFDYGNYLRHQGISGTVYCDSMRWRLLHKREAGSVQRWFLHRRESLLTLYRENFEAENFAVLSALSLGDKRAIDAETQRIYSETGAGHVLALSGLHLSILFGVFQILFLNYVRRRWLYVLVSLAGILFLWSFVLLAGSPISLVRAAVMFSICMICKCLYRDGSSFNNLAVAALLLLLCSPRSLFDVGFQLSFTAVFSILILHRKVWGRVDTASWHGFARRFYEFLTISISAQIGTLPLLAYYFHQVPIYALLINFVVIPATYLLLCGALLFFLFPFLREWVAAALDIVLSTQLCILDGVSHWQGAVWQFFPTIGQVVLSYVLVVFLFNLLKTHRSQLRSWALACVAAFFWTLYEAHSERPHHPAFYIYDVKRYPAVHYVASPQSTYLWGNRPDSALLRISEDTKTWWRQCGWSEPQLLRDTVFQDNRVATVPLCASFGEMRVAMICESVRRKSVNVPLQVDILLMARGSCDSLHYALRLFRPREVVLDASLGEFYRDCYLKECSARQIPCYDIAERGVYVRTNF